MITEIGPRTSDIAGATLRRRDQVRTLVVWFAAGLFALGTAIILADLAFPEPTILRLPLMLAILTAVGLLVARCRRDGDAVTSARSTRHFRSPGR